MLPAAASSSNCFLRITLIPHFCLKEKLCIFQVAIDFNYSAFLIYNISKNNGNAKIIANSDLGEMHYGPQEIDRVP